MNSVQDKSHPRDRKKNSIINRFRRAMILGYVVTVVVSSVIVGFWSRHEVYAAAGKDLSLLVDMFKSVGTYVLEDVRPEIVAQNVFHAPALSPVVATKRISDHLLKIQPDYYVKTTSDNPLNPRNYPEPFEENLLERFRDDSDLKTLIQEGTIKGRRFLTSSRPSVSKASCLECHGGIDKAPKEIVDTYGTNSGFNYPEEGVVGASIVGVPLANLTTIILQRSLTAASLVAVLFGGLFVMINRLVQRLVLNPVAGITEVALDVSGGNLEREIIMERQDEIGELANSFELIRRSLVTATNLLYRQRQKKQNEKNQ